MDRKQRDNVVSKILPNASRMDSISLLGPLHKRVSRGLSSHSPSTSATEDWQGTKQ